MIEGIRQICFYKELSFVIACEDNYKYDNKSLVEYPSPHVDLLSQVFVFISTRNTLIIDSMWSPIVSKRNQWKKQRKLFATKEGVCKKDYCMRKWWNRYSAEVIVLLTN